jgi:hypothetical protein
LSIPALLIITPFIQMFPVGLGLKILFGSSILTVLTVEFLFYFWGLRQKTNLGHMLFIYIYRFFAKHIMILVMNMEKLNQIVYFMCMILIKNGKWATYDSNLDTWTKKYLGNSPENNAQRASFI